VSTGTDSRTELIADARKAVDARDGTSGRADEQRRVTTTTTTTPNHETHTERGSRVLRAAMRRWRRLVLDAAANGRARDSDSRPSRRDAERGGSGGGGGGGGGGDGGGGKNAYTVFVVTFSQLTRRSRAWCVVLRFESG